MCSKQDKRCKVFHMITRINEVKTLVNHISCDCKCKSIVQHVIQKKKKWNNNKCE